MYASLPMVTSVEEILVDISVAFEAPDVFLRRLTEAGEEVDAADDDADDEDDDEDDDDMERRDGESKRAYDKRMRAAKKSGKSKKSDDEKPANTLHTYSLGEDIELVTDDSNPGTAVLTLRNAGSAPISDETVTSIRESTQFIELAGRGEKNATKMENFLNGLASILEKLNAEESMVSLSGLEEDDDLTSSDSKRALSATLQTAGSLEQRRADARRNDLSRTYVERLGTLSDVLFKNNGATQLTPGELWQYAEASEAAFNSAYNALIATVE